MYNVQKGIVQYQENEKMWGEGEGQYLNLGGGVGGGWVGRVRLGGQGGCNEELKFLGKFTQKKIGGLGDQEGMGSGGGSGWM